MKPGNWWRAQNSCVDSAKLILLSDKAHRNWFNLNCVANAYGGVLPSLQVIAVKLRVSEAKAAGAIAELVAKRLFDKREDGTFVPHDWNEWQFKTDKEDATNAERQKRYRERHRNGNSNGVTTGTVKRPETETETDRSEATASDAGASVDHRKRLFNEGLEKLKTMTGKGPDACRSFVGKCLKASGDDAIVVLGLIEDAERNQAVDPSAWIAARLKNPENGNGKTGSRIIQAADDLRRKIASFDGPPSRDQQLRSGPGEAATRLLSNG